MISLEKWMILTTLPKLHNNVGELGKIIVATGFEWLPKVQKFAQSGHTGCHVVWAKLSQAKGLPLLYSHGLQYCTSQFLSGEMSVQSCPVCCCKMSCLRQTCVVYQIVPFSTECCRKSSVKAEANCPFFVRISHPSNRFKNHFLLRFKKERDGRRGQVSQPERV